MLFDLSSANSKEPKFCTFCYKLLVTNNNMNNVKARKFTCKIIFVI